MASQRKYAALAKPEPDPEKAREFFSKFGSKKGE